VRPSQVSPGRPETFHVPSSIVGSPCEILDIDDTFCAAHGSQQLAFWNAHHDERGFAPMHIYHIASGTPVVAILRPARTAKGGPSRFSSGLTICYVNRGLHATVAAKFSPDEIFWVRRDDNEEYVKELVASSSTSHVDFARSTET
jgi:hypothetical protein